MTALEHVLSKAQTLKEALEKVQSNHFYWQKKTKPLLEATLKKIQTNTDLNWNFQDQRAELVRLVLVGEQGQEIANLSFRLTYNSLVSIVVSCHTKSYQPETDVESFTTLYSLEPGLVDESLIYKSVTQFVDQILKEYNTSPITFKDPQAKANTVQFRVSRPK